jgi:hypothetical protein
LQFKRAAQIPAPLLHTSMLDRFLR